jgi:NADH-quinone oxidoreductase subunit E
VKVGTNTAVEFCAVVHDPEPEEAIDLAPLRQVLNSRYRARDSEEAYELIVGACQEAQRIYGWVPPDAAQLIAEHLGVTVNRVYGLLTFYADFRTEPPGKHFLWLCHGAACYVLGSSRLIEWLRDRYGIEDHGVSSDGELTLHVFNGCLGVCDLAPVIQVDHERYWGRLTPERLESAIEALKSGERVEEDHASLN